MRCLYCGKTLALLKRLTGGGEFCSDAHRIKYQEEYNQLALSRLLQALTDAPASSVGRTLVPADVTPSVLESLPPPPPENEPATAAEVVAEVATATQTEAPPEPQAFAPEPEPAPVEEPAPPMGAYLAPIIEINSPGSPGASNIEPAVPRHGDIELPARAPGAIVSPLESEIGFAPLVAWTPGIAHRDMPAIPKTRMVELREFTGKAALPALDLQPAPVHGVPVTASVADPLPWSFAPRPAPDAQPVWSATLADFGPLAPETGALARLDFTHSGYEELAEAAAREPEPEVPAAAGQIELPAPDPKPALRIVADPSPAETKIEPSRLPRPRLEPARLEPVKFSPAPGPSRTDSPSPARPARVAQMPAPPYRPQLSFAVNYGQTAPGAEPVPYAAPAREPAPYVPPAPEAAPYAGYAPPASRGEYAAPAVPSYPGPGGYTPAAPTNPAGQVAPVGPPAAPGYNPPVATPPPVSYTAPVPPPTQQSGPAQAPAQAFPPPSTAQSPPLPAQPAQAQPLYVVPAPAVVNAPPPASVPVPGVPVSYATPQQPVRTPVPISPVAPQVAWPGPALVAHEPEQPVRVVPPPKPDTRPLPVTLHAMAAPAASAALGRAEALQPPTAPQIPRSSALPLRPLMYLGPAPEAKAADAPKIKGKANGKQKRPDARVIPPEAPPPVEKLDKPRVAAEATPIPIKPEAKVESKPEPKLEPKPELVTKKPEPAPTKPEADKPEAGGKPQPVAAKPEAAAEKPEAAKKPLPKPLAPPATEVDLGLPTLQLTATESRWARLPGAVKFGLAAALVLILCAAAYLVVYGDPSTAGVEPEPPATATYEAGIPLVATGWVENWTKARRGRGPRLDILPTSMQLSDYRIEFRSEILSKASGWVYRALNPRNYYAAKLEITREGEVPEVSLVRLAVIDGREERLPEIKIPPAVEAGKTNTVKFEAVGGTFTVWVQDKQVAEWTDRRIGSGGVGIYIDTGESSLLKGVFRVTPLIAKN